MKKSLVAGFGVLTIVAIAASPAHAEWRRPASVVVVPHHGWNGAGVALGAAGVVTTLGVLGALAAPPAYYPPPVVYATPPVVYAPYGYWRRY